MLIKLYYIVFFITVLKSIIILRKNNPFSQNYFFVFLTINFLIDCLSELNIINSKAVQYNYLNLFNIYFFGIFYLPYFKSKVLPVLILIVALLCVIFTRHYFYFDKYNLNLAILYCITNIFYSLYWINLKLNNVSEIKITSEPLFWISASILIWSCFFLFRIIPMYLLDEQDKQFLKLLKSLLLIINIMVYSLFYIGLTKYKNIKDEIFAS